MREIGAAGAGPEAASPVINEGRGCSHDLRAPLLRRHPARAAPCERATRPGLAEKLSCASLLSILNYARADVRARRCMRFNWTGRVRASRALRGREAAPRRGIIVSKSNGPAFRSPQREMHVCLWSM